MYKLKNLFLVIGILTFLVIGICFAGTATISETEYGYMITGGTDATTVNSGDDIRIRKICFLGNQAGSYANLTTGAANNHFVKLGPPVSQDSYAMCVDFGSDGIVVDNLKVTLSNSNDIVNIFN